MPVSNSNYIPLTVIIAGWVNPVSTHMLLWPWFSFLCGVMLTCCRCKCSSSIDWFQTSCLNICFISIDSEPSTSSTQTFLWLMLHNRAKNGLESWNGALGRALPDILKQRRWCQSVRARPNASKPEALAASRGIIVLCCWRGAKSTIFW